MELEEESVPHGCGDGPSFKMILIPVNMCSPRVWGWPVNGESLEELPIVFPTGVGMARWPDGLCDYGFGVPHGCGDGPTCWRNKMFKFACSPRVWGWPEKH